MKILLIICPVILLLLPLIACVYSKSLNARGNAWKSGHKKHRHNTEFAWDTALKKREQFYNTIPDECCPSVTEIFQPLGGVAKNGRFLELYRGQNSTQSFYQTSCKEGVKGKACKYVQHNHHVHSMCVQRYTYTYALVREFNSDLPWRMDYIRIRSACTCEIRARVPDDYFYDRTLGSEEEF
ncbi:uncharacterized protein B0416.2 isoform X1 [Parasteatoda tepidariorum]|uniref:uncharacterized protein B0416.2 isoform X1 n=1 Tax=Parasteatoda tepidariorum TaxID=114398 RepID=UPI001C71F1D3|nr:uncharacterized protein B0416.2 isoform X1 [Parasteatoda tepidariorum]